MAGIARMRTIRETAEYFKQQDSETRVTEYCIRAKVKSGELKAVYAGCKALLDIDKTAAYFAGEANE